MATWVGSPKSYSSGRNRPVQYVVIHATDGSEAPTSAEDGAAYDKRRTDGTSTHLFVDSNTAVREVQDTDRAHHARYHGNEIGIGIELCGRAGQSDAQWHDAASKATLAIAAREVAEICTAHGIPVRRLSVAEVRAAYYAPAGQRPKGICGHIDVTKAYPEDNGDHTDPGAHFPWTEFLAAVKAHQTGAGAGNTSSDGGMLMLAKFGDKGAAVETLQRTIIAAGGKLPKYGPDGDYGAETATALKALVGGDGKTYGPVQYVALTQKAFAGHGAPGPQGPAGPAGPQGTPGPAGRDGIGAGSTVTITGTVINTKPS